MDAVEGHPHDFSPSEWPFADAPNDPAEGLVVCLGCMFEKHPSIAMLSDLPAGWRAWRENVNAPWQKAAYEPAMD